MRASPVFVLPVLFHPGDQAEVVLCCFIYHGLQAKGGKQAFDHDQGTKKADFSERIRGKIS